MLSAKLEILSKIDDKILKLTSEDEIEQENDLADQTKEKVCLAINGNDYALDQAGQQVIPTSVNLPQETLPYLLKPQGEHNVSFALFISRNLNPTYSLTHR